MSIYREFHYRPRSLAQISYARREESALDTVVHLSRTVARVLNPIIYRFKTGIDFSKTANIRVSADEITLFVRAASQKQRLSQLIPRLEDELHQNGFTQRIVIRLRPMTENITLREHITTDIPRRATENASAITETTARDITDPELRAELMKLASALRN